MTTILIVDDCEEIREFVTATLESNGFTCFGAETSSRALEMSLATQFQLVICDLVLPLERHDDLPALGSAFAGLHCISELKKLLPRTPLIAISGEMVGAPLSMVQSFGATATLAKPFSAEELLQLVNTVCGLSAR